MAHAGYSGCGGYNGCDGYGVYGWQEIFHVTRPFFLGDAIHANDLSSLFAEGAIPRDDEDDDFDRR
jgi:hypothetical protein